MLFLICLAEHLQETAAEQVEQQSWFMEQTLVQCRSLNPAIGNNFLHLWTVFLKLPQPITDWLTCTTITFQQDLLYLCCASRQKPLINVLHTF